uniref:Uncharacterized protein n=1 Tax=Globisporangium ultimum (strain ATCC 200006 / CBS 805.95 / DAOM BR144) TaxID=431595 RepID=K3WD25_GLOUD
MRTHDSTFYVTKLNHYDMMFRYGDSLFSKSKKPVKWFKNLRLHASVEAVLVQEKKKSKGCVHS